ncbi:cell division regulator GpsB [Alteribacillus iranensis]|uniref:DivIVA domain-containing protein n=1 Tax=Alteribacillus iranensis TaxID=930128 RepID=A0A1I1ZY13_9BACI|nr:cell division regulator GpsB [Alteribacillus iranensis]SFE36734.1 DivIVA domain-containing protein [Alteribacillus iranensis]
MENIRLTAKEILDKDFKTSMKGYNKDEVDQFLDLIIQDYEAFNERIRDLETELEQTKQHKGPVATNSPKSETTVTDHYQTQTSAGTNYDILKRLSNLEKEVFGKKLYE